LSGEAYNREPHKSEEVRWFGLDELPENLTMTARNAIVAYCGLSESIVEPGETALRPQK
jgi:hypothetical protein